MRSGPARTRAPALLLIISVAFTACSDLPTQTPDRVAFPRGGEPEDGSGAYPDPGAEVIDEEFLTLPSIDDGLFRPVRNALAGGDWLAARLALPVPRSDPGEAVTASQRATDLWVIYYRAKIEYLRGDLESHAARVAELSAAALPVDLEVELLEHQLSVAEARGDQATRFDLARRLLDLGGHPARNADACQDALWQAAQRLVDERRRPRSDDTISRGWLDLATTLRSDRAPTEILASLASWQANYLEHPGTDKALSLAEALRADASAERYTLLLPLSGPLAAAGDALARGALAGYYAENAPGVVVDIVDSRRYENVSDALLSRNGPSPAVVLGPLGKRQVAELLQSPPEGQAILTLNRPEQPLAAPTVLQLALAPEDEARQLAELAFAEGARRVLLVRPESAWGERISRVFEQRWSSLGGKLAATARYAEASGYSRLIRDALALDASEDRGRRLRSLFSDGIETSGRRRDDLDAVFLLTRSSDEARALKPLLNYHYAGNLPTYALSTADAGGLDPARDRDLEGLRLLVMPWRLQEGAVPGLGGERASGSFDALHALGSDAYRLARRWSVLHSDARPLQQGFTAELQADASGVLHRRLQPAEFSRGRLTPL
ncbi:MAG: penicillin-binding protein activator [Pseudomonadota bacterium]